jgi:hypothetical protein
MPPDTFAILQPATSPAMNLSRGGGWVGQGRAFGDQGSQTGDGIEGGHVSIRPGVEIMVPTLQAWRAGRQDVPASVNRH